MRKKKASKPAGRGRPRKKFPLDAQIIFMARPTQKDRYVAAAEACELDLSAWLRSVADRAADEVLG